MTSDNILNVNFTDSTYHRTAEQVLQSMEEIIEEGIEENGKPVWCDFDMNDIKLLVNYTRALEKKIQSVS